MKIFPKEGLNLLYNGNQKKVIVIKNTNGKFFEEAYFILKEESKSGKNASDSAMIREANRIVNENFICPRPNTELIKPRKPKRYPVALWFLSGALFSGSISAVLFFLIR